MNVVSTSGDVLHHHHHALTVSVVGTDEDGDFDSAISPDEEGRTRRRPARGQSRIEFERLAAFFHVPINEAAKGLGVCATVLKKVCRKHGIPRWPHRKIKKLDTMLAMLETAANKPGNPQHDDDVRKKMEAVMRDRAVLMTEGKLIGEGKSDSRRSKDGKGRDRKRKKPDDDDEEDNDADDVSRAMTSYSLGHSHSSSEQDLLQGSSQMLMGPMNHMSHMGTMEMSGGYHLGLGSYQTGYGSYPGASGYAMSSNSYTSYNPLFWNNAQIGMTNNVSLPGVHSISSGVISSTTGMMMHNLPPPLSHSPLSHSSLSLTPTPISPLTPSLSSSNPLPIPLSKHAKLLHSDALLEHHSHSYPSTSSLSSLSSSPSPSPYLYHRSVSASHLYSDFSVQNDTSSPGDSLPLPSSSSSSPSPSPSSHFRLTHDMLHPPPTTSE